MKQVETPLEGYTLKSTDMVGGCRLKLLQTDSVGEGVECSEGMTESIGGNLWASQVVRGVDEYISCLGNMEILRGHGVWVAPGVGRQSVGPGWV